MAQNISLWGASYSSVPRVLLPKTGGGTAPFDDNSLVTATASDVLSGKDIVDSSGDVIHGSLIVQHYYTGSSAPSSSLGVNGDIYLQT